MSRAHRVQDALIATAAGTIVLVPEFLTRTSPPLPDPPTIARVVDVPRPAPPRQPAPSLLDAAKAGPSSPAVVRFAGPRLPRPVPVVAVARPEPATVAAVPMVAPSIAPTPTAAPSPSPVAAPTPTTTASPTPDPTPTPSYTPTPTPTPTPSPTCVRPWKGCKPERSGS